VRKLGVTVACALALAASPSAAIAEDAGAAPTATITCEHVDGPGRVRCDVEARVGAGESITWGDVVILRTPTFVSALRGRIGAHDATSHDPDVWRWGLALVARDRGAGDVEGRVRLVVCKSAPGSTGLCGPVEVPVVGRVVVGADQKSNG
jgi:hypothetical protein